MVKPEEKDGEVQPQSPELMSISYDETSITTSSPEQISGVSQVAAQGGRNMGVLRHFERTHRRMTIHADGSASLEVRYLEGNSDIHIPLKLYNRIKPRLHPPDPARKPITRYTIINNTYTGYAEDGSVVHVQHFPQQTAPISNDLAKMGTNVRSFDKAMLAEQLVKSGARFQQLNEREILVERVIVHSGSQVFLKQEAIDTEIGRTVRAMTYDQSGRPSLAQRFRYQVINDFSVPSLVVTHRYGEGPGGAWGVQQTTMEQRTNISVKQLSTAGHAGKERQP
jgi:hypothetical protein